MATTSTASVGDATGAAGASAAASIRGNTAKEIQERFLTLLVTQMKNQDPLNPLDNAQVTSQLAQVSTVTGVESLNTTMKSLLDQMNAMQMLQTASMVGRDVLVPGNVLSLEQTGIAAGAVSITERIDGGRITIKDAAGVTIRDLPLAAAAPGTITFEWDGLTDGGRRAAPGEYTFTVSAAGGGRPVTTESLALGRVLGVVRDDAGKTLLNVAGVGARSFDQVKQVM